VGTFASALILFTRSNTTGREFILRCRARGITKLNTIALRRDHEYPATRSRNGNATRRCDDGE
jgi:hypothetical protein